MRLVFFIVDVPTAQLAPDAVFRPLKKRILPMIRQLKRMGIGVDALICSGRLPDKQIANLIRLKRVARLKPVSVEMVTAAAVSEFLGAFGGVNGVGVVVPVEAACELIATFFSGTNLLVLSAFSTLILDNESGEFRLAALIPAPGSPA
ncbi:hypothetical protein EBR96_02775 [bacterium]|nr:hypothetical protein [bacterium]